jgi:signal transduction histidine kinase
MPFRVNARTILHLGSELISSDAVAFYELIKNAFDARSKRVDINIISRIPHEMYMEIRAKLVDELKKRRPGSQPYEAALHSLQSQVVDAIDITSPDAVAVKTTIAEAESLDDLLNLLDDANNIEITDSGEGMSFADLNRVYLTVGTRSRLAEREVQRQEYEASGSKNTDSFRPILGEKGVGRLSAMRLGNRLRVRTTKSGESNWNILEIDWSWFSHESDDLIEDIDVTPKRGEPKPRATESGTSVHISALTSDWSKKKLHDEILTRVFSKLTDPFDPDFRYRVAVRFNEELAPIPELDETLFRRAHAVVEAEYVIDEAVAEADGAIEQKPRLKGKINYRYRERRKSFDVAEEEIRSIADVKSDRVLISLGPFKVKFYWFNRGLLTAAEGVPDYRQVQALVKEWAGGLMVYRDGFRVNPYGDPEDDWLDLDRKALASAGYKVNRRQIIGKVEISSMLNPGLVDQTNREGLRDSEEKQALVNLLKHVLSEFRTFLNQVDKKVHATEPLLDLSELETRVARQERQAQQSLRRLVSAHSSFKSDPELIALQDSIKGIRALIKNAKELAENYVRDRDQFVHLAGLGLMVEIIGHELTRATDHALITLGEAKRLKVSDSVDSLFRTLKTQLGTLQKRLRVLDPLSTSGRQRKTTFDLIASVKDILTTHEGQFQRHGIHLNFQVQSNHPNSSLKVNAVEGMIVQILENLISNSVYWLDRRKEGQPGFVPEINVTIDPLSKMIYFTDNGPGVRPEDSEIIFQPFVTKKKGGEGKGLGLFISREIANYNGATLYLSDEPTIHPNKLNRFVFTLEAEKK